MPEKNVCCVILNWNGWQDTLACLESLTLQTEPLHVVVVDNFSTNDSAVRIQSWIAEQHGSSASFEFVQSAANLGFAGGVNLGIRAGRHRDPEFFWLLNNDTVCPTDTLAKLLTTAQLHPRAGIVASVLYYAHAPGEVQAWGGGRMKTLTAYATHFHAAEDFNSPDTYATFASVLVRSAALNDAGLLDEGFFMYYEDADLSLRIRAAGWQIVVADTAILHKEGGSATKRRSANAESTLTQSGLRFIGKHARWPALGGAIYLLLKLGKRAARLDRTGLRGAFTGARIFFSKDRRG